MQSQKMTPNSHAVLTSSVTNDLITGAWPSAYKFVSKFFICTKKVKKLFLQKTSKTVMSLLQIVGFSASKYEPFFG